MSQGLLCYGMAVNLSAGNNACRRRYCVWTFTDHSQNSIKSYIQDFNVKDGQTVVKYASGVDAMTGEQLYLIRHFSYGCTKMLMDWLLDRYSMPTAELARLQYQVMPKFLGDAYERYYEVHHPNMK